MCHKLIQTYACNHTKIVCMAACPHALETGRRIPRTDSNSGVSLSNSTVSSMTPSPRRDSQPRQLREQAASSHLLEPLPEYRITSPSPPPPPTPSPSNADHDQTSPTSPPSSWSNSFLSPPTSPTRSVTPPSPTLRADDIDIVPNYCPYHFPRYTPQSNHPCIDCYMLPEWEYLSKRWMRWYRFDHLREKIEDVERLTGIEVLREKQARRARGELLNVFVDGDETAGRKFEWD
jgi:hypothetical protein